MQPKRLLKKLLWKVGYDVNVFSPTKHSLSRRKHIIHQNRVKTVLDVGANAGQWATQLRNDLGYAHRIISFEPLNNAFQALQAVANKDAQWDVLQLALGRESGKVDINVANNSQSSSMLQMMDAHVASAPESQYIGTESIEVRRLDAIFQDLAIDSSPIYLKIDTQGFEEHVVDGAAGVLDRIDLIQLELSLVQLYEGEPLLETMCAKMRGLGYDVIALEESGFSDPETGHLLQVDAIFKRKRA